MNQTDILLDVIEAAKVGPTVSPDEALSLIAAVINQLDKYSVHYPKNVNDLFSIGACIWQMQSG